MKKPTIIQNLLGLTIVSLLATACGDNFTALGYECQTSNCVDSQSNTVDGVTPVEAPLTIEDVNLDGVLNGGNNAGLQISHMSKAEKSLTLTMPVSGGAFLGNSGDSFEVPGHADMKLELEQLENGHAALHLTLPWSYLVSGLAQNKVSKLPNGRELTNFQAGSHGHISFPLGDWGTEAKIYLSPGQIGFYLDLPINPHIELNYPYINQNQQLLGHLTQFPATDSEPGALFLSLSLSSEIVQIFKNSL